MKHCTIMVGDFIFIIVYFLSFCREGHPLAALAGTAALGVGRWEESTGGAPPRYIIMA
jgi:hypothetical protein